MSFSCLKGSPGGLGRGLQLFRRPFWKIWRLGGNRPGKVGGDGSVPPKDPGGDDSSGHAEKVGFLRGKELLFNKALSPAVARRSSRVQAGGRDLLLRKNLSKRREGTDSNEISHVPRKEISRWKTIKGDPGAGGKRVGPSKEAVVKRNHQRSGGGWRNRLWQGFLKRRPATPR